MFRFRKILVPTDFSEPVNNALNYAREIASSMNAELVVLHVIEPVVYPVAPGFPEAGIMNYENELENASRRELERIVTKLSGEGLNIRFEILSGSPSSQIVDYAAENNFDLICISTHGRSGIEHLLFGSTTEKVLRKATCPVLAVRYPKKHEDTQA